MSHLLDDDDELPRHRGDREVTLSTGAILGIFFGLTLICGFFFAFGYNMGHKASPSLAAAGDTSDTYTSSAAAYSSSPKPSAGSPLGQSVVNTSTAGPTEDLAGVPPRSTAAPKPETSAASNPKQVGAEETLAKAPTSVPVPTQTRTAPSFSGGTFVVQVAAVSHQEDAELLVSSLQKKGYSVAARNEPGDKLVHVQVGPFNDHKEADAMKDRLQSDGFHAMIKQL